MHKNYLKAKSAGRTAEQNVFFIKFKKKRNLLSTLIKQAKSKYYDKLFSENKKDIKQTWIEIKKIVNLSKKTHFQPNSLRKEEALSTSKYEIADEFN